MFEEFFKLMSLCSILKVAFFVLIPKIQGATMLKISSLLVYWNALNTACQRSYNEIESNCNQRCLQSSTSFYGGDHFDATLMANEIVEERGQGLLHKLDKQESLWLSTN